MDDLSVLRIRKYYVIVVFEVLGPKQLQLWVMIDSVVLSYRGIQ